LRRASIIADRRTTYRSAKRNQKFAEHFDLDSTDYCDWVVTGYFYSALHWIDAYLVRESKKTDDGHASRNTLTNTDRNLTPISRNYRKLYSYSRNARYELLAFTPEQVRSDVSPKVKEVRTHMERLLLKK
jgi:hypothetical protein